MFRMCSEKENRNASLEIKEKKKKIRRERRKDPEIMLFGLFCVLFIFFPDYFMIFLIWIKNDILKKEFSGIPE